MGHIRGLAFNIALASCLGALSGCGSTATYYPHESRSNVHLGKGGSRFQVQGIDVWFNGEPSRKYAILGYIEDHGSRGIDERHRSISPDVLEKAIAVGANGLIETVVLPYRDSGPSTGVLIHGGSGGIGMGFGFGFPLSEYVLVKYTAVKYLD